MVYKSIKRIMQRFFNGFLGIAFLAGSLAIPINSLHVYAAELSTDPQKGDSITFSYTGSEIRWTVPAEGYYKIYCYGAKGGNGKYAANNPTSEGYGCHANQGNGGDMRGGMILLKEGTELTIHAGGSGGDGVITTDGTKHPEYGASDGTAGWNDGTNGGSYFSNCDGSKTNAHNGACAGGGGGGSTYISINGRKIISAKGGNGGSASTNSAGCANGQANGGTGGGTRYISDPGMDAAKWELSEFSTANDGTNKGNGKVTIVFDRYSFAITSQPISKSVVEGAYVAFNIETTKQDQAVYQWQESRDQGRTWINLSDSPADDVIYAGAKSRKLEIYPPDTSYDQYRYRCLTEWTPENGNKLELTSAAATLTVCAKSYKSIKAEYFEKLPVKTEIDAKDILVSLTYTNGSGELSRGWENLYFAADTNGNLQGDGKHAVLQRGKNDFLLMLKDVSETAGTADDQTKYTHLIIEGIDDKAPELSVSEVKDVIVLNADGKTRSEVLGNGEQIIPDIQNARITVQSKDNYDGNDKLQYAFVEKTMNDIHTQAECLDESEWKLFPSYTEDADGYAVFDITTEIRRNSDNKEYILAVRDRNHLDAGNNNMNISVRQIGIYVKDDVKPVIKEILQDDKTECIRSALIAVTANDNYNPSDMLYRFVNEKMDVDTGYQEENYLKIIKNGDYTVYVMDCAGNISESGKIQIQNIDSTGPDMSINVQKTSDLQAVNITFDVTETERNGSRSTGIDKSSLLLQRASEDYDGKEILTKISLTESGLNSHSPSGDDQATLFMSDNDNKAVIRLRTDISARYLLTAADKTGNRSVVEINVDISSYIGTDDEQETSTIFEPISAENLSDGSYPSYTSEGVRMEAVVSEEYRLQTKKEFDQMAAEGSLSNEEISHGILSSDYFFSWDGSTWKRGESDTPIWNDDSFKTVMTARENGKYTAYVKYGEDGHIYKTSIQINNIDKEAPNMTVTQDGNRINLSVRDEKSGIDKILVFKGKNICEQIEGSNAAALSRTLLLTELGDFSIQAIDALGNTSESVKITVKEWAAGSTENIAEEYSNIIDKLESDKNTMEGSIDEMNRLISEKNAEIAAINGENTNLQRQLDDAVEKRNQIKDRMTELEGKLDDAEAKIRFLKSVSPENTDLQPYLDKISEYRKELKRLEDLYDESYKTEVTAPEFKAEMPETEKTITRTEIKDNNKDDFATGLAAGMIIAVVVGSIIVTIPKIKKK